MQLSLDLSVKEAPSLLVATALETTAKTTLETELAPAGETRADRAYRLRKMRYDSDDFWEKQELSGAIAAAEVGMDPAVIQEIIERVIFGE